MKMSLFFVVLLAAGIVACNGNNKGGTAQDHSQDSVVGSRTEKQSQLVLNNGNKWKLDEATRSNMDSIRKTVQIVGKSTEKNYVKAASDLENDANRLVSQCRMSGKDHDMLHLWLENFLSDLKQLKTSSKEDQPMAFERIETLVNQFGDYFE